MENFIWTDEKVKDAVHYIIKQYEAADMMSGWKGADVELDIWKLKHIPTLRERIERELEKQKEEPKKYPEEIIAFKTCSGLVKTFEESVYTDYQHYCLVHLDHLPISTIHSVKNKDGEIFTVNDEVYPSINGVVGCKFKIQKFLIDNSKNHLVAYENDMVYWTLDILTKVEKQLLFLSDDGENIYMGDTLYPVDLDTMEYRPSRNWTCDSRLGNFLYFKKEENASKYAAENRKSISYKELHDWAIEYGIISVGFTTPQLCDIEQLLNHFKPK